MLSMSSVDVRGLVRCYSMGGGGGLQALRHLGLNWLQLLVVYASGPCVYASGPCVYVSGPCVYVSGHVCMPLGHVRYHQLLNAFS